MSDATQRRVDREMLRSMEISFRSGLGFSFNPQDLADLMRRMAEMVDPKPRAAPTADLPPTLAEVLTVPGVKALVIALRPFDACIFNDNGDVTISTGHLLPRDWLRLRAALRDLKGGA